MGTVRHTVCRMRARGHILCSQTQIGALLYLHRVGACFQIANAVYFARRTHSSSICRQKRQKIHFMAVYLGCTARIHSGKHSARIFRRQFFQSIFRIF